MSDAKWVIPNGDIYENWSLSALMNEFQSLTPNNKLGAEEVVTTELKNLAIIREIAARIAKKSPRLSRHKDNSPRSSNNDPALSTRACYLFTVSFGIFQRAVGSYLFGSTIFLLIPHISSPLLLTLSLLFVVFDSLLFYAFDVSFLKNIMGMVDAQTKFERLNQIYLEQRQLAKMINRALDNVASLKWCGDEHPAFVSCKKVFNAHLLEKLNSMKEPERTWRMVCFEYAIVAFGAFSSITDSYFAFTVLHLSFLTPIGAIIALGMVISGLVLYYAMGVKSVDKLINPNLESFKRLKQKLSKFATEFGEIVEESLSVSPSLNQIMF
jgi:hypothetical protein